MILYRSDTCPRIISETYGKTVLEPLELIYFSYLGLWLLKVYVYHHSDYDTRSTAIILSEYIRKK